MAKARGNKAHAEQAILHSEKKENPKQERSLTGRFFKSAEDFGSHLVEILKNRASKIVSQNKKEEFERQQREHDRIIKERELEERKLIQQEFNKLREEQLKLLQKRWEENPRELERYREEQKKLEEEIRTQKSLNEKERVKFNELIDELKKIDMKSFENITRDISKFLAAREHHKNLNAKWEGKNNRYQKEGLNTRFTNLCNVYTKILSSYNAKNSSIDNLKAKEEIFLNLGYEDKIYLKDSNKIINKIICTIEEAKNINLYKSDLSKIEKNHFELLHKFPIFDKEATSVGGPGIV